ncbi:LmeA family phospholipid-binding protein [Motilibacter peucedani]|uniref:LmeA family phospholipid-binding protein n=1 Tax=Motilibacter peucedani TaxID=598650 RepID=UPI0015FED717|nr:DUF2993 domain-containing protein [Motilibacter peucedani]
MRRSCLGALLVPVVAALVALALLTLAVDRSATWVVGRAVESSLKDEGARAPHVHLRGFPFLTQLVHRDFSHVEVTARAIRRDGLVGNDVVVEMWGVRPDGSRAADVDRVQGHLTVPYSEVEQRTGQPAGSLSTDGSRVRLTRTLTALGRRVTVSGEGTVRVSGSRLVVTPTAVTVDGAAAGAALLSSVRRQLATTYAIEGLPAGLRVSAVSPVAGGLLVDFTGRDARLER